MPNRKPRRGDPFVPDLGLERELRNLVDYNKTFPSGSTRQGKGEIARDHARVMIRNNTGSRLDRYAIVSVGSRTINPDASADKLRAYQNTPYHDASTPTGDVADPICILLEPLANGAIGPALAMGVIQCQVDFPTANVTYQYARSIEDDKGKLTAATDGNVEILNPRSVDAPGVVWCLVRLLGGWFYSDDYVHDEITERIYTALECGCLESCLHPEAMVDSIGPAEFTEGGANKYLFTFAAGGDPLWAFADGTHVMEWNAASSYWETTDISGTCKGGTPPGTYRWRMEATGVDPKEVTIKLKLTAGTCPDYVELIFENRFDFVPACGNLMVLRNRHSAAYYDRTASCAFCLYPTIETETKTCICSLASVETSKQYGIRYWTGSAWGYEPSGVHSINSAFNDCCISNAVAQFPKGVITLTDADNDCIWGEQNTYLTASCADNPDYTWQYKMEIDCSFAPSTYKIKVTVTVTKVTSETWVYESLALNEADFRTALVTSSTLTRITAPGTPALCNMPTNLQIFAW